MPKRPMTKTPMIGEYRADYSQLTPEEIAHDEPELVELYANSEERRCQKCGRPTKGEEAWIDGQYWCHSCADGVSNSSEATSEAIKALADWHKFQSSQNTTTLYNAASKLFGSDFDPREYDDVE